MATRQVPISGGPGQFRPTKPVKSTSNTSSDAERQIMQSAAPFANPHGTVNVPTGRVDMSRLGIPYTDPKPVNARPQNIGKHVGCASAANTSADMLAAVGEPRLPSGYNPIMSGRSTAKASRRIGNGSQPKGSSSNRKEAPFYGQR